jgi:carbamoyl-phosphate synthase small subunit
MTQPHIGNYGMNRRGAESGRIWVEGFIARQFTAEPSNFGSEGSLVADLRASGVPALDGIDTRALVRKLRERGALRGVLTSERSDVAALLAEVRDFPVMTGRALVDEVTCGAAYELEPESGVEQVCHLAVLDFGAKRNILRSLQARGARLTVLPARTPAARILALEIDGVVLSNGPGDPEPLVDVIETVREIADSGLPTFGICLGHQLLGLAMGGTTFKLKFGHHGGNQPVVDLATRAVTITSQNHGFSVDPGSLPAGCFATEVNLNDGTLESFGVTGRPILSVQYHPEAAPGPHDASPLFGRFLDLVATGLRTARV